MKDKVDKIANSFLAHRGCWCWFKTEQMSKLHGRGTAVRLCTDTCCLNPRQLQVAQAVSASPRTGRGFMETPQLVSFLPHYGSHCRLLAEHPIWITFAETKGGNFIMGSLSMGTNSPWALGPWDPSWANPLCEWLMASLPKLFHHTNSLLLRGSEDAEACALKNTPFSHKHREIRISWGL